MTAINSKSSSIRDDKAAGKAFSFKAAQDILDSTMPYNRNGILHVGSGLEEEARSAKRVFSLNAVADVSVVDGLDALAASSSQAASAVGGNADAAYNSWADYSLAVVGGRDVALSDDEIDGMVTTARRGVINAQIEDVRPTGSSPIQISEISVMLDDMRRGAKASDALATVRNGEGSDRRGLRFSTNPSLTPRSNPGDAQKQVSYE